MKLTREPVRLSIDGTFPIPGLHADYMIGNETVREHWQEFAHAPMLACDIETSGLGPHARFDIKAVTFATPQRALILDPRVPAQAEIIRSMLRWPDVEIVFHNSPFDVPNLGVMELIDLEAVDRTVCTLTMARLADPDERTPKDLAHVANRCLHMQLSDPLPKILKTLRVSREKWYREFDLDTPMYRLMAATDAVLTARIRPFVERQAYDRITTGHPFSQYGVTGEEAHELVWQSQIINRHHLKRSIIGLLVDPEYVDEYQQRTWKTLADSAAILETEGIRPTVSASLVEWMDREGLIPEGYPKTAKTRRPSGNAKHLALLDHPLARTFVAHKVTDKVYRDYLSKTMDYADETGRIHPVVSLLKAATGREAMGSPPIHQFPEDARGIILADDHAAVGKLDHETVDDKEVCRCPRPRGFTSIDWSQIEPVILANVAGDVEALAAYESGEADWYKTVADFAGQQRGATVSRSFAKITLLAVSYGEGMVKLATDMGLITNAEGLLIRRMQRKEKISQVRCAQHLGIDGFLKAVEIRDLIFKVLPRTHRLTQRLRRIAENHRLVFTMSGRILPIPAGWYVDDDDFDDEDDAEASWLERDLPEPKFRVHTHKGVNFFTQGSAYDLLANAQHRVIQAGLGDAMYFAMHDELIVDAPAAYDIRNIMETPPERLCFLAKRTPVLRTDMKHLGKRWAVA